MTPKDAPQAPRPRGVSHFASRQISAIADGRADRSGGRVAVLEHGDVNIRPHRPAIVVSFESWAAARPNHCSRPVVMTLKASRGVAYFSLPPVASADRRMSLSLLPTSKGDSSS